MKRTEVLIRLIMLSPARCTPIVSLSCAGRAARKLERAASNACRLVLDYYTTNEPTIHLKLLDAFVAPPPSRREKPFGCWGKQNSIRSPWLPR